MIKEEISKLLEILGCKCLQDDNYQNYSDEDLVNATIIFSHIILDVLWTTNQDLPKQSLPELAETVGKAIHELVLRATDKDLKKLVNQELAQKEVIH